jgi:pimeloyl-[acyl-carrier protein] synthase
MVVSSDTLLEDPFTPLTPEKLENPYPYYARLRENAPVWFSKEGGYWLISRYEEVNAILRDIHYSKRMTNAKGVDKIIARLMDPRLMGMMKSRQNSMLAQDPPDHTRLRGLVNKAFTPKMVEGLRPHIESIAKELIDNVANKGKMDLIADFAFPLPVTVISEMLGIPTSDRDKIKEWSRPIAESFDIDSSKEAMLKAKDASEAFTNYLKPLVAERRKNPKEDLISGLIAAEEEGNKLTEQELFANLVLILLAGHETTVNLIGNGMVALLRHPDQLQKLKENPSLIGTAVDEVLRYDSSVQLARRVVMEDVQVHGQTLKKGDMCTLMIGSANHDPAVFPDPEKFDITRTDSKYLSFGAGIHHCLGSSLAKAEGEIAISMLTSRLPNMKLATDKLQHRHPAALRGFIEIPVTF